MRHIAKTVKGKRKYIEDMYTIAKPRGLRYFAVFDGHAGDTTARYCQTTLHKILATKIGLGAKIKHAIKASLYECNEKMRTLKLSAGNTAVMYIATPTRHYFASLGDSLVLLVRHKKIVYDSPVYKIEDYEEARRIVDRGGVIVNGRINNYLAVSRSMGDFDVRGVITEPTVDSIPRKKGDLVILVSDGVTDRYTPKELVAEIVSFDDLNEACNKVLRNSIDNATIIVVCT